MAGLEGKDYFTVAEAAEYACISVSQWRAKVQPIFQAAEFYGRLIYRKSDVQRFIETRARWPHLTPNAPPRGRRPALTRETTHSASRRAGPRQRGAKSKEVRDAGAPDPKDQS